MRFRWDDLDQWHIFKKKYSIIGQLTLFLSTLVESDCQKWKEKQKVIFIYFSIIWRGIGAILKSLGVRRWNSNIKKK